MKVESMHFWNSRFDAFLTTTAMHMQPVCTIQRQTRESLSNSAQSHFEQCVTIDGESVYKTSFSSVLLLLLEIYATNIWAMVIALTFVTECQALVILGSQIFSRPALVFANKLCCEELYLKNYIIM